MFKDALVKLLKNIVFPAFKKLFQLFAKEIIEFIFITIKDVIRKYWSKKEKEKEADIQRMEQEAEVTENTDEKNRLLKEIELLRRDIENLKQYQKELEAIIDSAQEKASKEVESKLESSKAVEQIFENGNEEPPKIDEKKEYLQLGKPNEDEEDNKAS